ncbi:SWF/SNF family helicase [Amycolatopsis antarctica]|uniref:SWF/SNF family helicase n=1 Tax=Amycolatopsis antarctica TaxID=1854586 RepID=A0A263D4B7_9PSEU|nr:SWIM zinc finger family protein [Amycolatopsis antarctica]OZM73303.1 SWF/SNF family helicase [Amycolatopsis antarctica]
MSDTARGFPAFGPVKRGRGRFARSWWGEEWISAMEDVALHPTSLAKGRRYARNAHVGSITVSPGLLSATVFDDAGGQHHTRVHVERLGETQWERFLDQVAATAGHIAALLDRDMPHDLVTAADDAGVPLLPGFGDLEQECSCGDWGQPCRHAAALSYQAAWLLDADPFLLLLLRGRGERELTGELQRRNAVLPEVPQGIDAAEAFAAEVAPLPAEPDTVGEPALPPRFPAAPGIDPAMLALLVTDTAARARTLPRVPVPALDVRLDAVRLAAAYPELEANLLHGSVSPRAVRAWRYGGAAFVEVLDEPWSPPAHVFARARAGLAETWDAAEPPAFEVWRNRWTSEDIGMQLRYGRDGRWYPLCRCEGDWWPAGAPAREPVDALSGASGTAGRS